MRQVSSIVVIAFAIGVLTLGYSLGKVTGDVVDRTLENELFQSWQMRRDQKSKNSLNSVPPKSSSSNRRYFGASSYRAPGFFDSEMERIEAIKSRNDEIQGQD